MRVGIVLILLPAALAKGEETAHEIRFAQQEKAAFDHYNKREWEKAIAAFEKQIAIFQNNPSPYYNIACCYALQGKAERAATWLKLSIDRGWRDLRHLQRDPDFDKVRQSPEYKSCVFLLREVRKRDPDPLPEPQRMDAVRPAPSARAILVASAIQERQLERRRPLLVESQFRRRLFRIYDHRLGRLSRYLAESGDARDAPLAAHERVRTAMLYLARADRRDEADRGLMRASALLVYWYAEQFLRGWAHSPLCGEVCYWRAHALGTLGRHEQAERSLRALVADLEGMQAGRALAELCAVLAETPRRKELRRAVERLERDYAKLVPTMLPRLTKAMLLAKGIAFHRTGGEPKTVYFFLIPQDFEAEARLRSLRGMLRKGVEILVVPLVREPAADDAAWLEKHAKGMRIARDPVGWARDLWVARTPTLVVAAVQRVLAVDPTDAELAKLLAE